MNTKLVTHSKDGNHLKKTSASLLYKHVQVEMEATVLTDHEVQTAGLGSAFTQF